MKEAKARSEAWVLCRLPKAEICYFRYTLEAYEGLCVATTLPSGEGVVRLLTSTELRPALEACLAGLAREVPLEVLAWGEGAPPEAVTDPKEGGTWIEPGRT